MLILGILIGLVLPHAKLYHLATSHFLKAMKRRGKKIHELMLINQQLRNDKI